MDTESPAPAPAVPAGIDESTQSSRVRGWARVVTCCTAALLCLTVLRVAQLKVAPPGQRSADRGVAARDLVTEPTDVADGVVPLGQAGVHGVGAVERLGQVGRLTRGGGQLGEQRFGKAGE